ncbi:MAG: hypothetical protein ACLTDX_21460, partial [[Clostridium] innocuum]
QKSILLKKVSIAEDKALCKPACLSCWNYLYHQSANSYAGHFPQSKVKQSLNTIRLHQMKKPA